MTDDVITEVKSEIGKIKKYSTNESDDLPNLFSNCFWSHLYYNLPGKGIAHTYYLLPHLSPKNQR